MIPTQYDLYDLIRYLYTWYGMIRYGMICHVVSCHVMLCYIMLYCVTLYYVMLCFVMNPSCFVLHKLFILSITSKQSILIVVSFS